MRYLLGILGFAAGIATIVYREQVKRVFGNIPAFEKYFGVGGTYTGIMFVGFLMAIGSILFMTGTAQEILKKLLGPIFGI